MPKKQRKVGELAASFLDTVDYKRYLPGSAYHQKGANKVLVAI
jgi:hypothetical protein